MTGHWVHELSISWTQPLDTTYPTLAEVLARRGYATAGFTANILNTGTGTGIERGFLHYEDYPTSFSGIVASTVLGARVVEFTRKRFRRPRSEQWGRKTAPEVSAEFLAWERRHRERPFFAFLNYFDAHDPYPAPEPFDSLFGLPRDRESPNLNDLEWRGWPSEQFAIQRSAYEATIAYVDRALGALVDALQRDGRLDNTILIITADHGEEFHEHQLMGHGNSLYRPALQVPLVLRFPARLPAGTAIPTPVSLRDLPATIMDLIGSPNPEPFPGRTLLRYLEAAPEGAPEPLYNWVDAEPIQPDWFPVAHGPLKGIILGDHRYMVDARGREEFYSLADTLEQHDLSRDSTLADRIALYRRLAAAQVRSSGSEAAATTDNQP